MRKVARVLLIGLAVTIVAALVALPLVLPPLVTRFAKDKLVDDFGILSDIDLKLGYCWRNGPGVKGSLEAAIVGTAWRISAEFGASCSEWSAHLRLPETRFCEQDPLLRKLLSGQALPPGVSNLVFSGSISLEATAERTFRKPVAEWRVKAPIKDLCASLVRDEQVIEVSGLSLTPGAYGIADHMDIQPIVIKAASVAAAGCVLTNLRATVRATERALMVSEASAGFCSGMLNVYSVYLDHRNLNAGLTLFLDDIDAGQALRHVQGFQGDATGRLHGKMRVFVREGGRALRLSDAYLYSTPGETGKLRVLDKEALADNLAYAGLDDATRQNIAEAMTDLDYKILRMDLRRLEDNVARLTVRIGGTATRGSTSVPVDVTVNLNGELEQLINTGLGFSARMKGKN